MRSSFLLLGLAFLTGYCHAQDSSRFKAQIYIGGFSSYGINLPSDTSISSAEIPGLVYGFKADYKINHRFSFGLVHGWQSIDVSFLKNNLVYESGKVNKLYLGFRGLIHYGSNNWDLYSGLKLGYVYKRPRKVSTLPGHKAYLEDLNNDIVFQPGIIAFGAFYSFTDFISVGSELSIGSPSFLSFGMKASF